MWTIGAVKSVGNQLKRGELTDIATIAFILLEFKAKSAHEDEHVQLFCK